VPRVSGTSGVTSFSRPIVVGRPFAAVLDAVTVPSGEIDTSVFGGT
jgi:hypothetical protein